MDIALIGLGKMGLNLAKNLIRNSHKVYAYDLSESNMKLASEAGAITGNTMKDAVEKIKGKKVIWLMIPAGDPVDETISLLKPSLRKEDIVIDGGNSNYKDSIRRYKALKEQGVDFLDCGTSGGLSGALNGACTMVGGEKEVYQYCKPVFDDISVPNGSLYVGVPGSGHFVKMVHNGIEYGMMQAIAEGFEMIEKSAFDVNYEELAKVWNHGSVIRGWLMELTQSAFSKNQKLDNIKGIMHSSGEGKWAMETALELEMPAPIMALSLMMRYRSQETDTFSGKVVAALRNEFGGHKVEKAV